MYSYPSGQRRLISSPPGERLDERAKRGLPHIFRTSVRESCEKIRSYD
jgi:hypothetical protein